MLSRLTAVQLVSSIGVLFLLLVLSSTILFTARQWQDHRAARAELSGLPAAEALLSLAKLTGEHRGMAAGMLAGDPGFRRMRAAKQIEVERALVAMLDATRGWTATRIAGLRDTVRAEWQQLCRAIAGQALSSSDNFSLHGSLVQHQLELLDEIVNASTLALETDPVAHYLIVAALERQPQLGENIGQLRGVGVDILARPAFAPGDASLIVTMMGNRRRMFEAGMAQLRRTGDADPAVHAALAPHIEHARTTFARASALIMDQLLQTERPHMTATDYFAAVTTALDAQSALARATFAILSNRLHDRVDAAWRAVAVAVAIGAALVVLCACMIWSIIRTVRRDITRRENALGAAAHSTAFLSSVLDAAPDAFVILDGRGMIERVSSRVEQAFGYPRNEVLGKPAHVLFPDSALAPIGPAGHGAGHRVVAVDCTRKDGTKFPVELGISPVDTGGARHIIVVGRDVSERRAMEQQLQQSQKMESIGQLTGGLAHDFNNLLGVIIGNLDLLERHVTTDAKALARVQTAQRAAIRGSDLTKRLLAFARRQQLNPQATPVNQLLEELLEMLPRTLGPEIRITTKLAPELPSATVDPAGLESALLNLSLNARDAMPQGGRLSIATGLVELDAGYEPVRAGEIAPGGYIRITVSDSGHGMTPETLAKVFEPFFTTKPRGKGTGLGLSMVYGFVKQSRGNIRIYSEVGVGTTFTIYLPVADAGAPSQPAADARAVAGRDGTTGTVLIVDDEIDLLEIAVTYCEQLGLTVLHATDGQSALEVAAAQPHIDLLLTDVVMPGLNGVKLAAQLRARYPRLKVIYCSGFPSSSLAERSQLQVDGPLINKPYLKPDFIKTVTETLATSIPAAKENAA